MNGELGDLIAIIRNQQEIYDDLLKLAARKTEAITKGDVSELDYVVKGEELLLMKLGELETKRRDFMENTAKVNNIEAEKLTISNWPDTDKACKDELRAIQTIFLKTLEEINAVNNTNQQLINLQLGYIKHVIEETASQSRLNSYDVDGTMRQGKEHDPRLVDIRM